MTALSPATAGRLSTLADQLDAEALGRLPFGSAELAEALAQGNAVRALVRLAASISREPADDYDAERLADLQERYSSPEPEGAKASPPVDLMAALKASMAASGKGGA